MKSKILLIICTLLVYFSNAQITILRSDLPIVGDTLRYSTTGQDLSSLVSKSGASQTWDASGLIPDFQDIAAFKSVASINIAYLTSFSNSNYGCEGEQGINLPQIQTSDEFDFYKVDTNAFVQTGRGFALQGIPLSQIWRDSVLCLPLIYGQADSCKFMSNSLDIGIAKLSHSGKRVNTIDGWGILTTAGTVQCIRVKSVVKTIDSIVTTLVPIPIAIPTAVTEYKWYAKNKKIPMLEVVVPQVGGQASVKYRDITRPEAFIHAASFSANKTTFSTSNTDTCVLNDNSVHRGNTRTWIISPNTFQFTGGTDAGTLQAKILFTAAGTYTIKLKVNYNAGSDDTVAVNCITVGTGMKANFAANNLLPTTNTTVNFTDSSTGNPTAWKWTFDPTSVTFVSGTTDISQNPKVIFTDAGFYTVSLSVQSSSGSDLMTKQNYILCMTTGLNEMKADQDISVFPNPAQKEFAISGLDPSDLSIELMDLTGKLIFNAKGQNFTISGVDNGFYLIRIYSGNNLVGVKPLQVIH